MPAAPPRVHDVGVKIGGTAIGPEDYAKLHDLRVEQSIYVPSMCVARFRDPDFSLLDADFAKLGDALAVELQNAGGDLVSVFAGEVTAVGSEQGATERHELVVTALAKTYKLARGTELMTYTNKSYADVVRTLAGDAGLTIGTVDSSGGAGATHEYLYQTTNAYAYIGEIARQLGFVWWVDTDDKFYFKPRKMESGPTLTFGPNNSGTLRKFSARYSSVEGADKVTVTGSDPKTLVPLKGDDTTVKDQAADIAGTKAPVANRLNGQASAFGGEISSGATVVETEAEAKAVAKAVGERLAATRFNASGTGLGNADIFAGGVVTVEGVGTSLTGDYFVSTVQHTYSAERGAMSHFEVGGGDSGRLVDLLQGAGPTGGSYLGQLGLVIGKVVNTADPDAIGRIKVMYDWLDETNESHWAKVVGLGAGKGDRVGAGLQIMPSVDDHVLVGFERGDTRRPLVLGGVWTSTDKPPMAEGDFGAGTVHTWRLESRKGSQISLSEGDDNQIELLLHDDGSKININDENITIETADRMIELKDGTGSISLDGSGNVVIDCEKMTVTAKQAIELTATQDFKAKGMNAEVKGDTGAKLEGGATVDVKGGAAANVKAGIVNIN